MRTLDQGACDSCGQKFGYYLIHSGFNDSQYAYCDRCGMTSVLNLYDKRLPNPLPCPPHGPICEAMEPLLSLCSCGWKLPSRRNPAMPSLSRAAFADCRRNLH